MPKTSDILCAFIAAATLIISLQAHALPESYVYGFLSGGGGATTNRNVAPGIARDSTNTFDITLTTTQNADLTSSGAGGLDTGSIAADTWYALYVIADSSGSNATDVMFSASFTSPTLPSGYDKFRRVGSAKTTSSSLIRGYGEARSHTGPVRLVYYLDDISNRVVLSGGSATSKTAINLSEFIPPSIFNGNGDVLLLVEQGGIGGNLTLRSTPFNLDEMYLRSGNDAQVLFRASDWQIWYLNDSPTASTTIWIQGYFETL